MRLLLFVLSALGVVGQVTITVDSVNSITDVSARYNLTLSSAATVYAQFGMSTSYGSRGIGQNSGTTNAVVNVVGLVPGRTNYVRFCQTGHTPPTGCTAAQSVATLQPQTQDPTMPTTLDLTYPSSFTTTYTVGADCEDPSTGLQAYLTTVAGLSANNNYLIQIPAGTYCGGLLEAPAKSGTGTVVVTSTGTLPPVGARITTEYSAQTAIILQSTISDSSGTSTPATCTPTTFFWESDVTAYHICTGTNTWELLSSQPGFSSAASDPAGACTSGRYYQNTTGDGRDGLWYCHSSSKWIKMHRRGDGGYSIAVPDRYTTSTTTGYRFVGLTFENLIPGVSTSNPYMVSIDNSSRIIADRCIFKNQSGGTAGNAFYMSGAGVALINSHVDMLPPGSSGHTTINITSGTGPFQIDNNYLRGCAFIVFANDNGTTVPRSDISITGNTLTFQAACNPLSPSYDGRGSRDTRAVVELKRGTRVNISGNIFEDYYTESLSNGSAILVTPRANGSSGGDDNDYQVSDLTISNNIFRRGGGLFEIWGQDSLWYRDTRLTSRVNISNNLAYDVDGNTYYGQAATRAVNLYQQDGIGHLQMRRNSFINVLGTGPAIVTFTSPVSSAVIRDNIFWLNQGLGLSGGDDGGGIRWTDGTFGSTLCDGSTAVTGSSAKNKLDLCWLAGTAPFYTFYNNAIVGGVAGYTATYSGTYPSGNHWPGDTTTGITALDFVDYDNDDFRLSPGSSYAPLGVGADIGAINAANGVTYNLRVVDITDTAATVLYTAPDTTTQCTVEYGANGTAGTGTRVTDTTGSRNRSKGLTGLTASTTYYYRVYCKQEAESSFTTTAP